MQAAAQKKEQAIQGGFLVAQQTIAKTLEPILQHLMQQRGANMILDKNAMVYASPQAVKAFDITQPAIEQLNQKLPALKVSLGRAAGSRPEITERRARQRSMADPRFYNNRGPFSLAEICARAGIAVPAGRGWCGGDRGSGRTGGRGPCASGVFSGRPGNGGSLSRAAVPVFAWCRERERRKARIPA